MSSAKPVLYSYFRSSCSWRVRIALLLKGLEFETRPINLLKGENRSDEYLAICPMGQVPTLVIDGHTMTQSVAIIEYLEEAYKERGTRLLPDLPVERAVVRELTEMISSGMQPLQNPSVCARVGADRKTEWGHYYIDRGFQALEKRLLETSGKYCFKNSISIADVCLVPQVYNAGRFNVDMTKYPTISRINQALLEQQAFIDARPDKQADCPDELRMQ
ncbi:hypothetical protein BOX15_Mlig027976g2 [Macrostomum lignano]|uniref:Uncharacterized protein n=2 Tax=Macrostomum lignano TaxID=282301 RepID=A0A267GX49_9PLAT|nr:hypothetical protein BOX15_Mlig005914g2 [Macrostomum lignano]PAA89882.1 hypothetical protein BOX15_Mlig027976g2 [Macrostomum lignano]